MTETHKDANTASAKAFWKRSEAGQVYDVQFKNKVGLYIDRSEMLPVMDFLGDIRSAKILDIGCGTGRFLPYLSEHNDITGADLSESMLLQAAQKTPKARLLSASAIQLPFADNSFDAVYSVRVIQHIRDQEKMIAEMIRVCKPGGKVLMVTYNTWSLLNLYKQIRMRWIGRVLNFPIGWLLKQRSFFGPWGFEYDNYCSAPEVKRMMRTNGADVAAVWGTSTGMPWFLQSFFIGKILDKTLPFLLAGWLKLCLALDRTYARVFPFSYFMDLILVAGIKKK